MNIKQVGGCIAILGILTIIILAQSTESSYLGTKPRLVFPKQNHVINEEHEVLYGITDTPARMIPHQFDSATFEFSSNGVNWMTIDTQLGSEVGDRMMWETVWDVSGLQSGQYFLALTTCLQNICTRSAAVRVFVNEKPIANATATHLGNRTVFFNATLSRDPDGAITNHQWRFGDGTQHRGATINHTYPANQSVFYPILTVTDNSSAKSSEYYIANFTSGFTFTTATGCRCNAMVLQNAGVSDMGMYWMPAAQNHALGAYNNINMSAPGDPVFQIVNNFEIEATLNEGSNPKFCTEGQSMKYTARVNNIWVNASSFGGVSCPFGGTNWCDDDYHNPTATKEYDGLTVRWIDGPGTDALKKSWLANGGFLYKLNFKAEVTPTRTPNTCICTWDVIFDVLANGTVTKNQIENLACA